MKLKLQSKILHIIKGVRSMEGLININTYKSNYKIIDIKVLQENLIDYRSWLRKTNRDDKIENYEKFLQAK